MRKKNSSQIISRPIYLLPPYKNKEFSNVKCTQPTVVLLTNTQLPTPIYLLPPWTPIYLLSPCKNKKCYSKSAKKISETTYLSHVYSIQHTSFVFSSYFIHLLQSSFIMFDLLLTTITHTKSPTNWNTRVMNWIGEEINEHS